MDFNGDFCSGIFFQRLYNQDQGKDLAIMASRQSDRSRPVQQIGVETCEQFVGPWNKKSCTTKRWVKPSKKWDKPLINWCNIFWNHPQYVDSQENMCQRLNVTSFYW